MSNAVRAKFKCESVTDSIYDKEVKMSAVIGNDGENADFSSATPTGSFGMRISKDVKASDFFTPGKSYYLDITEAPD